MPHVPIAGARCEISLLGPVPHLVMFRVSLIGVTAILLGLAGCGGGGTNSGGSTTDLVEAWLSGVCGLNAQAGGFSYRTTWNTAPANASQVLQVMDGNGGLVRTESLNRGAGPTSTLDVTNLPAGVYELRVRVFSQQNAGGTEVGIASILLDLCAGGSGGVTRQINTVFGGTATSADVFPAQVDVTEQQTIRFFATFATATGTPTFTPTDQPTWSEFGGVGTINGNLFTATTAGTGQVRATFNSLIDSAAVTVEPFTAVKKKWTVMVFLNAANDLYFASDLNVNQMESVAQNEDVRFVVQWKQTKSLFPSSSFDGVRRYLVKPDTTDQIRSELVQGNLVNGQGQALDMGDPQTLNDFITWAKTFYPADRYALILWNHGNGWLRSPERPWDRAFSYDDQYGTSIKQWETDQALAGHTDLDIIAWDSSLMQMLEVAYEARDYAKYIVGSEESPPAEGYPYAAVFDNFRDNPDLPTETLAASFVEAMNSHPPYASRKITQSVLDTTKLDALATSVDTLGQVLAANKVGIESQIQDARDDTQAYSQTFTRYYRDLIDLCQNLRAQAGMPQAVIDACLDVEAKAADAIVAENHNSQSPNSNGISIDFSPGSTFQSVRPDYIRLKFAQDTLWDEWLGQAP